MEVWCDDLLQFSFNGLVRGGQHLMKVVFLFAALFFEIIKSCYVKIVRTKRIKKMSSF